MADDQATDLPTNQDGEVVGMEQVLPPESPPMEDASGLPQGDAVEQPADDIEPEDEEAAAQLGSLS
ncbi:MAG TPA: hypothetical protein VM900_11260 [Sphingomonas sp.]|jgi:hypothetical protein|nr:hypothetical protein [Sphingomonas sp.]